MNLLDLERKKKVSLGKLITSFENPERVGNSMVSNLVKYNKVIDNYYDIFNNLTLDKLNSILDLYKKSCSTYIKLLNTKILK